MTTCAVCGGHICQQKRIGYPHEPYGPWLHLHVEDWHDNPHNAVPAEGEASA